MRKYGYGLIVLSLLASAQIAQAESLALTGKMHWLTLASTKDKDIAIGIARRSSLMAKTVKVVSSQNGYYAIILGPYAANSINAVKKADTEGQLGDLPKDALLSSGDKYIETVWDSKSGHIEPLAYSIQKAAEFNSGSLTVKIQGQKLDKENAYTSVDGKDDKGPFHFDIGKDLPKDDLGNAEEFMGLIFNQAELVKLVANSPSPQVVVKNNSGGAHCCTKTTIFSRDMAQSTWSEVEGKPLDGDGYWFEDLDGDGIMELLSIDNNFLYAFDSYAGSVAPIQIAKLQNGKIEDVSTTPAMHARLVQDLAGIEFEAKIRPEIWKENGFLAGWVASKIRLGDGEAAWAKVAHNMKEDTGFGPQVCTSGQKIDDCPSDNLKPIPVLKGLAVFLKENGYAPLPAAAAEALIH